MCSGYAEGVRVPNASQLCALANYTMQCSAHMTYVTVCMQACPMMLKHLSSIMLFIMQLKEAGVNNNVIFIIDIDVSVYRFIKAIDIAMTFWNLFG